MARKENLFTKSVYDPPSKDAGQRVLVMRLWPRGVKKNRVSLWLRDLAPAYPLLHAFKTQKISWPEFARRYRAGLREPAAKAALRELKTLLRKKTVTLLCACHDESRCHRTLLKKKLQRGS